jgi:3-oxoacyl-[acyl-carrier-protein] synthase-1/3-oxoacyl-[acyl-carrier-protein] synthase II
VKPVDIVAVGAVSGLGVGRAAFDVGSVGAAARTAIQRDSELDAAGLRRPFCARVDGVESGERDRARQLLLIAARGLCAELDQRVPGWRERRIGFCIGTSGGGMPSQVRAFERRAAGEPIGEELARSAPYFGPLSVLPEALGARAELTVQVLAACASSTVAIGLGCRWLELERVDLVVAGGYDAMSIFIAAGFEALGATSATLPAPFRSERDGMALGEGAALLALTRSGETAAPVYGHVLGFAASSDAVHITAPDRTGTGLARAARGALADAGMHGGDVDLVSAHATATPFNDAAEACALSAVLGSDVSRAVVHPFKAVIGHTLGAAGALELLSALDAAARDVLPAAAGSGAIEPALAARLFERNTEGKAKHCLKLSAAFGGANAALAAGRARSAGAALTRRPVHLLAVGLPQERFDLEVVTRLSALEPAKLARLDALSELAVSAAASALERWGRALPETSGVVVGSAAATIEINDAYDQRRRERGARFVEPRRFPPTSPNLAGGQCSIAFGLHGLSLAVGAGLGASTEALLVAYDVVEAGDADVVLVIAAEQVGEVVGDIWRAAGWPVPRHGAAAVLLGADGGDPLDRGGLVRAHAQSSAEQGRLGAAEPGWPVLLAAVALGRGSGA